MRQEYGSQNWRYYIFSDHQGFHQPRHQGGSLEESQKKGDLEEEGERKPISPSLFVNAEIAIDSCKEKEIRRKGTGRGKKEKEKQ